MTQSLYSPSFARFYDVIYNQLRSIDQTFYAAQLSGVKGPCLEIGSGTGRLLAWAVGHGIDIYGLEPSPAMIQKCKAKLPGKQSLRINQGFAQTMDLGRQFELIIAPFRVFQHLLTIEDQLAALERVAAHLKPGGRLIFDAFVPDLGKMAQGKSTIKDFDGEWQPGCKLERHINIAPEPTAQLLRLWINLHWQEEPNGDWSQKTTPIEMHYYHQFELQHLVERSSLELEKICGDFSEGPVNEKSKDFVVFCRKPK